MRVLHKIISNVLSGCLAIVAAGCSQESPDHGAILAQCQLEYGTGGGDFTGDKVQVCMRARGYVVRTEEDCKDAIIVWESKVATHGSLEARRAWNQNPELKAAVEEFLKKESSQAVADFMARVQMRKSLPEPEIEYEFISYCYKPVK